MSVVTGKNINIYVSGDFETNSLLLIGCEETCTITFNTEVINTTTRGSGRARGREYGIYDVTIQSSGVVFINTTVDPVTKHDPMFFSSIMLEGKKCVIKYEVTDGANTRYYIGKFLVQSAVYTGGATGFGTYDCTFINDGELNASTALITSSNYECATYIYESTGSVSSFVATPVINGAIFFIRRFGNNYNVTYLPSQIENLASSGASLTGGYVIGFHGASGTIKVSDDLASGDKLLVVYNTAD
jgi:hypothetical protein